MFCHLNPEHAQIGHVVIYKIKSPDDVSWNEMYIFFASTMIKTIQTLFHQLLHESLAKMPL